MINRIDITTIASELRATLGVLRRRLRERGSMGDLSPSQIQVLRQLDRNGSATVSQLAREGGMRPQSMGAIVAMLESEGFVSCSPDPNDGRQTLISLTHLCQDKIMKNRAAREDWLVRKIEQLSSEEQTTLQAAAAILRRISED